MAAITGAVVAVGTAAYSIAQSEKQKNLSKQAEADADKAFTAAQKELDVNYFEELGISKTPYENQREALLVSAAQAMQQGQLSERGATATAGQVLAQANTSQQNVTDAQIQQTEALEKLIAEEDKSLAAKRAELQLAQAEGAGISSAQAQNASNASMQQGVTALANLGLQAYGNSELYSQNGKQPPGTPPGVTSPTANNADSFGVFSSDANQRSQIVPSQNMVNPGSFGVLSSDVNSHPQVVPSQNMINPISSFMNSSVNGSGLTKEQYLQLLNFNR